jgi:hypothetical protein
LLGRLQHANRAADIEFAAGVELGDLIRNVDAPSLLAEDDLEAVADLFAKLLRKREMGSAPAGVKETEARACMGKRERVSA